MEGDPVLVYPLHVQFYFNPLPPHGGRLPVLVYPLHVQFYFNPLPPHGGRLAAYARKMPEWYISIHSLRMEGDIKTAA